MYQNVKRTCRVLFWLINPIVLWRSRCRRRRRCLSSLVITLVAHNSQVEGVGIIAKGLFSRRCFSILLTGVAMSISCLKRLDKLKDPPDDLRHSHSVITLSCQMFIFPNQSVGRSVGRSVVRRL